MQQESGESSKAAEVLEKAIGFDPDNVAALANLGNTFVYICWCVCLLYANHVGWFESMPSCKFKYSSDMLLVRM